MSKKSKSTLLAGGLTSTAGLFITKAIGILYVAPFRSMVGAQDYIYYAAGYELYDLMLTISLAGLPFAIAALVSKYMEKEDYQSVMLIKKISQGLLGVFGFICATVVVIFINQFVATRGQITVEQAQVYKNVYLIMTLSIFTVPLLSSYRGFFQGIKDYASYSASQVIEQITRVSFLLGVGALCVYVLNTDRIYAVYAALIATAVSAVVAILYFAVYKKSEIDEVDSLANAQQFAPQDAYALIKELFIFAIPYLFSVILANRYGFANMALLPNALEQFGYSVFDKQIYTSLITNETVKLIQIPTVLATGFSVAVIPEMSQALARNDYKTIQKDISLSIESVLYIALPIFCIMFFMSAEIYYILFGGTEQIIQMGSSVTRLQVILGTIGILMPVITALTMTLNLRRDTIIILAIVFVLNFILVPTLTIKIGWQGSLIANIITSVIMIGSSLYIIMKNYLVKFTYTYRKVLLMLVCLVPMFFVYKLLRIIGLPVISLGKLKGIITLGIYSVSMLTVYLLLSNYLYLPQSILNVDLIKTVRRVIRR